MSKMTIDHTTGMQFVTNMRGHELTIDLPPMYKGEDTGPTPPELFIASLGSCIGVYVLFYLNKMSLPTEGVSVEMTWEDAADEPTRIGTISANVHLPETLSHEHAQGALEWAAKCKIHNTLHHLPEICVDIAGRPEVCLPVA